jgi:hypothetical protein
MTEGSCLNRYSVRTALLLPNGVMKYVHVSAASNTDWLIYVTIVFEEGEKKE